MPAPPPPPALRAPHAMRAPHAVNGNAAMPIAELSAAQARPRRNTAAASAQARPMHEAPAGGAGGMAGGQEGLHWVGMGRHATREDQGAAGRQCGTRCRDIRAFSEHVQIMCNGVLKSIVSGCEQSEACCPCGC